MAKEIIMPKFGMTQEEATIVQWLVKEGDFVDKDDPIAEVTTDKVNMEVEAPETGYLGGLRYAEGDTVPVTVVIGYILAEGEEAPAPSPAESAAAAASSNVTQESAAVPNGIHEGQTASGGGTVNITPVAKRMADAEGVDVSVIQGSGAGGKVTREDVEKHLTARKAPANGHPSNGDKVRATPAARRVAREYGLNLLDISGSGPLGRIQEADALATATRVQQAQPTLRPTASLPTLPASLPEGAEAIPLEGMRRTIANRLQASYQQAPHITFTIDVDMTEAINFRRDANEHSETRISMTAVLVKAIAWALQEHPAMNSHFYETVEGGTIVKMPQVNIGMAVALEDGLIVPVIHNAQSKGLRELGKEVADLAERARQGKLRAEHLSGGTFTISNLGMFGIREFSAIINPPEVGILAVGRTEKRFVPDENDQPVVKPMMSVTLAADHRVVDGAVAAQFLDTLRLALEKPTSILL